MLHVSCPFYDNVQLIQSSPKLIQQSRQVLSNWTSADQRSTCPNARSGNPGVSCRTLGARDCGLLLRVIAATLGYRRQHVVLGRDGAVVGLTVLVEECVVLGTRIGTYV